MGSRTMLVGLCFPCGLGGRSRSGRLGRAISTGSSKHPSRDLQALAVAEEVLVASAIRRKFTTGNFGAFVVFEVVGRHDDALLAPFLSVAGSRSTPHFAAV